MIKQLLWKLERRIFFKRGRDYHKRSSAQSLTFFGKNNFSGKDVFLSSKKGKEFSKKFQKFRFFTWEQLASVCTRVWWSDRACSGIQLRSESVCQWRGAPLHPLMKCASPTQCSFGATRRSLTRRSLENFGAILNGNGILSFHPCSARVPQGSVLTVAPWTSSPCEGVRLLRSTQETQEVVSNSGLEQEFCLFDHMRKFGTSSAIMHNEVAWERGLPPTAVVDVERAAFLPTRCLLCQDVLSLCAIIPGLSFLQRTRPGVLPSRPRDYVKRPDFIACGWIAVRVTLPKRQEEWLDLLRHTGGDGRRGRFPHRAVEAWHVQRRHALRSGAFDNWRSHHFCIPPGSARFQCGRGYVEAPPVLRRRCCWGQRVSSLPGNLYVLGVNEGQQGFCHLRLGLRAINAINAGFFRKKFFRKRFGKTNHFFCFPRKPLFSHASRIASAIESSLEHRPVRSVVTDLVRGTSVASSRLFFFFKIFSKKDETKLIQEQVRKRYTRCSKIFETFLRTEKGGWFVKRSLKNTKEFSKIKIFSKRKRMSKKTAWFFWKKNGCLSKADNRKKWWICKSSCFTSSCFFFVCEFFSCFLVFFMSFFFETHFFCFAFDLLFLSFFIVYFFSFLLSTSFYFNFLLLFHLLLRVFFFQIDSFFYLFLDSFSKIFFKYLLLFCSLSCQNSPLSPLFL